MGGRGKSGRVGRRQPSGSQKSTVAKEVKTLLKEGILEGARQSLIHGTEAAISFLITLGINELRAVLQSALQTRNARLADAVYKTARIKDWTQSEFDFSDFDEIQRKLF